jgi:hypothetical protein
MSLVAISEGLSMANFVRLFAFLLSAVANSISATAEQSGVEPTELVCDVGPITRVFGQSQWLVYSCDDRRTMIVLSAPGSAARSFYFVLYPAESGYQLRGEGTGHQDITAAAFNDLKALSSEEIMSLIQETRRR